MNIDASPFNQIDLWLDIEMGLLFPANSADSIYSTHMFEHFYPDELQHLLKECFRVSKPNGGILMTVHSLTTAIVAHAQTRHDWFYDDYPRHFDSLEAGSPTLFSVTASTGRPSISATWKKSCE